MLICDVSHDFLKILRPDLSEEEFDGYALQLLRLQADTNPVYRRFLQGLDLDSRHLAHWEDFPPLPASTFRDQPVACFPPERAAVVFETSGTTGPPAGRHYMADMRFYDTALLEGFRLFLPDLSGHRWISLIPPFEEKPHSSLAYMISHLGRTIPETTPAYFCDAQYAMDFNGLEASMEAGDEKPVALFGTSFALATAAEYFEGRGQSWQLPSGSIVFDTGGYKGRHRELAAADLVDLLVRVFGIASRHIYNEYGMTELSSQGYARLDTGIHRFPPWLKVLVRDPETGKKCGPGETGLVQLYDLANVGSVMAIGTLDLAVREEDGIRLKGRASDAVLRGCSLPYEA